MNLIFKPIELNEQNYNVTLLHQVLAVFELPVSAKEASQGKAGKNTLKKVRILQDKLSIIVDSNAILLDEKTILAIIKAMTDRGLLSTNRSFTVQGKVKFSDGSLDKGQRLIAFDLDLRGVAIYRKVNSITEIQKHGGFEYLAETSTDNKGQYSATFYDWQYQRAERKLADIVVFAIDKDEIIERSRIVNTEDYSDKGFVRGLDLIIEKNDEQTEYQSLMDSLNVFLKQSETSLLKIATSNDQLAFTARELDIDRSRLNISAEAELIVQENSKISHELLYGVGRQSINLNWTALYKQKQEDLQQAIAQSVETGIIQAFSETDITRFINNIQLSAIRHILDDEANDNAGNNTVNVMLSNTLKKKTERISFLRALNDFKGSDFSEFWNTHLPAKPEFKDKPELISGLLLTQQLTVILGNHQSLVKELQVNRGVKSAQGLIDLDTKQWLEIIKTSGVPDSIEGVDETEKMKRYADSLQNQLNAAYPTQRIARMVQHNQLSIEKNSLEECISRFLANNEKFDFASSDINEFDEEIKVACKNDSEEAKAELKKIQRVFQVSTSPVVMTALLKNKFYSAYSIANTPRKSFIKNYGPALGGRAAAFAVHQRAEHISTRAEKNFMDLRELSNSASSPAVIMMQGDGDAVENTLKDKFPNYTDLFGSPNICECRHCRSVLSSAAYFVDILRFLERSTVNVQGYTPYDILVGKVADEADPGKPGRRPDLATLALSCENTNTHIPYIDLVNEVMEHYVANKNSLVGFQGYNTGDATEDELRANPQHYNLDAYTELKDAKYPFSLPFHQPLDEIRTYSDFLKVSRYEVMQAINPQPNDATIQKAIEAESLNLSPEGYAILVDDTSDTTILREYFGYDNTEGASGELEDLSRVREFMKKSGVVYIDLVELVKTHFINPHQDVLDFIEKIFSQASIDNELVYTWLKNSAAGTPNSDSDNEKITLALNESTITSVELAEWAAGHFDDFQQVITLFEPKSECNLETTRLRTIEKVYEAPDTVETSSSGESIETLGVSGITADVWAKWHRFIRLWKKTGWSIHETDLILTVLDENDINADTINKLESVLLLKNASKTPLIQLAVLWGNIDTYGKNSLYKKLFLNKANQQIEQAFKANTQGNYLTEKEDDIGDPITLVKHKPSILAAFRISEEDLNAILKIAKILDDEGNLRNIDFENDILSLHSLSAIYRYIVLAKTLKMRVIDVCKLINLFNATPFSSPSETYDFYKLAASTKATRFKPAVLDYIFNGVLPADSKQGLDKNKILQVAKAIRNGYTAIEQDHPQAPVATLTSEIVAAKLSISFQSEIISKFMEIIEGTVIFRIQIENNLGVDIPDNLNARYSYIEGSGWFSCIGVMTTDDRTQLKNLGNEKFDKAVDELYEAPETFIIGAFKDVFATDIPESLEMVNKTLLNRPAMDPVVSLEKKLEYIYQSFLPLLKTKLQQDTVTTYIADLIGLSEEATALLLAKDINLLTNSLSIQGFSATYFNDEDRDENKIALKRVDNTIDFSWEEKSPDPEAVIANKFSARWKSYIAAPASEKYTLIVDVDEADEAFNLFLDGELIINKAAGDEKLLFEMVSNLNSAQLHLLTLEYSEDMGNAGIRLRWKTATSASEIIPSAVAYPAQNVDEFVIEVTKFHRAAQFILGFKISETELDHLLTPSFNSDFDNIDFKVLTPVSWQRIRDYTVLRNAVPQAQAFLTEVFALANRSEPKPTLEQLKEKIQLATAWDKTNLDFLVSHFQLQAEADDFKNEIALNRLHAVMTIVAKTGLSAETIVKWGATGANFSSLYDTAQLIKNTVKAKYDDADWLLLAANLSDKLREKQKQALISYLLVQPEILQAKIEDADGLYEYFLIDVQMGACLDTSRIVQASAAIQLFVNRILLNLEKDISPAAIDRDRWKWMKNYRVWEANRKIFLEPECFLNPEWRKDRSVFFKDLESHLLQNDITARSAEQGLRNYLTSLNEVANLDVCGMHQENYGDGKLKFLHVFARTHNLPYKYFYRRWNEDGIWSAWEHVQVDIRSVEDGENSGVHLVPVVWKSKLFLFWPEFTEKSREPSGNDGESVEDVGKSNTIESLKPEKYWEIRLAWSEYVEGIWSPKQLSKEFVRTDDIGLKWVFLDSDPRPVIPKINEGIAINFQPSPDESDPNPNPNPNPISSENLYPFQIQLNPSFIDESQRLVINISFESSAGLGFITSNIKSYVKTYSFAKIRVYTQPTNYSRSFTKQIGLSLALEDSNATYLNNRTSHQLLPINTQLGLGVFDENPFFFQDDLRSYFVQPTERTGILGIRNLTQDLDPYIFVGASQTDKPNDNPGETVGALPVLTEATSTGAAFSSVEFGTLDVVSEKQLEFHTFYHPFSSEYVTRLNQGGLMGLMTSDMEISSDMGSTFEKIYKPNFENELVKKHTSFNTPPMPRTAYKENICFDIYGANSLYNWELFFHAPLYIATRLSKNGKYKEAMQWFHYIFDPTTDSDADPGNETSRYWKVLPFKTTSTERLEEFFKGLSPNTDPNNPGNAVINRWRKNPFDPHLVASNRPVAYMKHVVIKYVENLIAWGDSLFRQFTRESVYEAIQLYVIANQVLGPRPEFVPKRGRVKAETYSSLKDKLDDFGNAVVELENIFPYSSEVNVAEPSPGSNILGIGQALFFCIPVNEKLLEYWDTVADRLFKIRHCQDLDGIERGLALFAPAISPDKLIQANSQGLDLGSILADLSSPPPIYRFAYLIQKANEFCGDVKALGSALLSALQNKDAEELSRLRSSQEINMLELVTAIRERQILSARVNKENLLKVRETAKLRLKHYKELLGDNSSEPADSPSLDSTLTANSQLPADTNISLIETDVDMSLVDSDESGVKLIPREEEELYKNNLAKWGNMVASNLELMGSILGMYPQVTGFGAPLGVGASAETGGFQLSASLSASGRSVKAVSDYVSAEAALAARMAGYIRRTHDWALQSNLVIREIVSLDKQITSADIQIQVAEKELKNHQQQIENAQETELFLKDKFTNQELYQWMKEQLFSVYKQSYNLAFEMAKKAQKAYQFEMGTETASFIQYGYWDNSKQGLVSGEKLQLALRQLENAYLDTNRRELELSKSISLALLNPLALIELRETGKCFLSLPEEIFDLDFQGHYFRRIKAVSLSIPCIAGPYTNVNCTLRLLKNTMRKNTSPNPDFTGLDEYEHDNDEGLLLDDDRFRASNVPVTLIATSNGQNDAGMFEFNFGDLRYLPFEGAGVISDWMIELSSDKELRQFDYETISDVILHLKYTARESAGLKELATSHLKEYFKEDGTTHSLRMFNLKHELSTQWHKFLHPSNPESGNVFELEMAASLFPLLSQGKTLKVNEIWVLARCTDSGSYKVVLTPPLPEPVSESPPEAVNPMTLKKVPDSQFGDFHFEQKDISPLDIKIVPTDTPVTWRLTMTNPNGNNLQENPVTKTMEVEDVMLILGCEWE